MDCGGFTYVLQLWLLKGDASIRGRDGQQHC